MVGFGMPWAHQLPRTAHKAAPRRVSCPIPGTNIIHQGGQLQTKNPIAQVELETKQWCVNYLTENPQYGIMLMLLNNHKGGSMNATSIPQPQALGKWQRMKIDALWASKMMMAAAMHDSPLSRRAGRMSACGDQLEFMYNPTTGKTSIKRASLCRDRLCPVCSWRLSMKRTNEMQQTITHLLSKQDYKGIMLTLTVKNCTRDAIRDTIKHLCSSYSRLSKHRAWKRYIRGSARSIEITYSPKNDDYHPHIHALLLVDGGYRCELTQQDFAAMWRTAARLDYTPIVDVRYTYAKAETAENDTDELNEAEAILQTDKLSAMSDGIIEATKYALKPSALRRILADEQLNSIAAQLAGHRLISYGGDIKTARAELLYADEESLKDETDDLPLEEVGSTELHRLAYQWSSDTQSYVLVKDEQIGGDDNV